MINDLEITTPPQSVDINGLVPKRHSRRIIAFCSAVFGIIPSIVTPASAQYAPNTPGVTRGGQLMFSSVTDERLINTLVMGEYLLIVCKSVPLPRMTVQVLLLRDEIIRRYGGAAKHVVAPAVEMMLAKTSKVNTAACADSPNIDF